MPIQEADQQLVERVQRGDRRAFDLLVLKYQHKVLNLVMRFVRHPQEAQDVTQEAFIRAYRAIANFRGDSAFYTWLYRIAVNTAKNHLTVRGRRLPEVDVYTAETEFGADAPTLRDLNTPESLLLSDEIAATVQQTLAKLSEELRNALILREFDGLSYEEIATTMQCPVGTVRSRIFRAREAIDNALKPLLQDR